jgi:hypothetical protein
VNISSVAQPPHGGFVFVELEFAAVWVVGDLLWRIEITRIS